MVEFVTEVIEFVSQHFEPFPLELIEKLFIRMKVLKEIVNIFQKRIILIIIVVVMRLCAAPLRWLG